MSSLHGNDNMVTMVREIEVVVGAAWLPLTTGIEHLF